VSNLDFRVEKRRGNLACLNNQQGASLVEILVAAAVFAILAALLFPVAVKSIRQAKKVGSLNNLKSFVQADMLYLADRGEFPPVDTIVPSSISRNRLSIVAEYCNLLIPPGPVTTWPRRKQQPAWINDPIARDSKFAEGLTVGGGVYTGYIYVGRVEESIMVQSGMATLTHPDRAADKKNLRRGVLWATILGEFQTSDPRRFECFHFNTVFSYPDFRFKKEEVEGQFRGWSDGSAEWVAGKQIQFGGSDIQIQHFLGNFYY